MTFLHPILLGLGGACVAIPIVIHLLMRRRRKPVRWAAMRFLLEAYKQRQRRVRLEQLLLLAARCLLVALIALAVGRPMLGGESGDGLGSREVYLLIDNSLASAIRRADGVAELDASIAEARAMIEGLDGARGDRAALITLGGPAEAVVFPATTDLALVERRLAELRPTDSAMDLAGGLALMPTVATEDEATRATAAIFSAFREGSVGRAPALGGLRSGVRLAAGAPAEAALSNTGLGALALLRPVVVAGESVGGAGQVRAGLVRSGEGVDAAFATTVRIVALAEGSPREVGSAVVRWTPGQSEAETTIDIDLAGLGVGGRLVLRAEIDRDANERDNTAWAVLDVREQLRVAVVGTRRFGARPGIADFGPSDWVGLAMEPEGAPNGRPAAREIEVEVVDAARLEGGTLAGFDAVIVAEPGRVRGDGWGAIGAFRQRGGAVVLAASPVLGAQLWTEPAAAALGLDWAIAREPTEVDPDHQTLAAPRADAEDLLWFVRGELGELAETVSVQRLLGVEAGAEAEVLLAAGDGSPVLVVSGPGGAGSRAGTVALLTTAIDLEWTDLPARPLMVPLLQELVRGSVGRGASRGAAVAGSRVVVPAGAIEIERHAEPGAGSLGAVTAVDPSTGLTRTPMRLGGAFIARDTTGVGVGALTVQPDAEAGRAGTVGRERLGAWLSTAVPGGGFAWSDTGAAGQRTASADRRGDGPGPGLVLLAGALALACVEVCLARLVSHASRPGAPA